MPGEGGLGRYLYRRTGYSRLYIDTLVIMMTETKVGAKIQVDVDLIDTLGIATGVLLPLGSLSKGSSIVLQGPPTP